MRILFTSDLHGYLEDFQKFADALKEGDYDCGVIAGDLLDDGVTDGELEEYFREGILERDDFIPELPDADLSYEDAMEVALEKLHCPDHPLMRALYYKEQKAKEILARAEKTIFLVPGNHDITAWEDYRNVINVHDRQIQFGKYSFTGYKWTRLHRTEEDHYHDIQRLKKLVNRKTILITHEPPYGIMDDARNINGDAVHLGSHELRMLVDKKKPKLHLFGHTHSSYGVDGRFVNGSYPAFQQFFSIDTKKGIESVQYGSGMAAGAAGSGSSMNVILDTDINADVDDAAAIYILNVLADRGIVNILGMTHCTSSAYGPASMEIINRYFDRIVPIGTLKEDGFLSERSEMSYTKELVASFPSTLTRDTAEDATRLLRSLLVAHRDISLLAIGPFINLYNLLRSKGDDISEKTGKQLIRQSVSRLVSMSTRLADDRPEYNIRCAPFEARYVFKRWPGDIVLVDSVLGTSIEVGADLQSMPDNNPLKIAYFLYNGGTDVHCCDLITCMYPGYAEMFALSRKGKVVISENGFDYFRRFGRHRYIQFKAEKEKVRDTVNKIILTQPLHAFAYDNVNKHAVFDTRRRSIVEQLQAICDTGLEELEAVE